MASRARSLFVVGLGIVNLFVGLEACSSEEELPARNRAKDASAEDATTSTGDGGGLPQDAGGGILDAAVSEALCKKLSADDWRAIGAQVKADLANDCRSSAHFAALSGDQKSKMGTCFGQVLAATFCRVPYDTQNCRDPSTVHKALGLKTDDFNLATQILFNQRIRATGKLSDAEAKEAVKILGGYAAGFALKGPGDAGPYSNCSCAPGEKADGAVAQDLCGRPLDAGNRDGGDAQADAGNDAAPSDGGGDTGADDSGGDASGTDDSGSNDAGTD